VAHTQLNSSTQLDRELRKRVSDTSKSASSLYAIINKQYHFITSYDRFPVPVRSEVKSNFTNWCCQNLSKRVLNTLTVQASTIDIDITVQEIQIVSTCTILTADIVMSGFVVVIGLSYDGRRRGVAECGLRSVTAASQSAASLVVTSAGLHE